MYCYHIRPHTKSFEGKFLEILLANLNTNNMSNIVENSTGEINGIRLLRRYVQLYPGVPLLVEFLPKLYTWFTTKFGRHLPWNMHERVNGSPKEIFNNIISLIIFDVKD